MWYREDDKTDAVLTAKAHIDGAHHKWNTRIELPPYCILFYMSDVIPHLLETGAVCITEKLPRFLNGCPVYGFPDTPVCFLDGGRGAPQAVDTLETLHVLGVKTVLSVGMCGGFSPQVRVGDLIIPDRAFIEEGTSLHYGPMRPFSVPDDGLKERVRDAFPKGRCLPIVSTDAVYRQTFKKEALWREQGAVGVDMETSALFTVAACLNMEMAAVLAVSDKHPEKPGDAGWHWGMTHEMRHTLAERCVALMRTLAEERGEKSGWI